MRGSCPQTLKGTMEETRDGGIADGEAMEPEGQKGSVEKRPEAREKWANKTEFLLSMAGEIIGLGNVWRFPYLCYKNGGGVFFIPYFIFLFFCGIPIFFLETALGQYTSEGGITAWRKICPMFEGVGVASQVIVIYLNIYYIVVLAWALFYLFNSFWSTLPWTSCDNYWNTVNCHNISVTYTGLHRPDTDWSFLYNETDKHDNYSMSFQNESEWPPFKVISPEQDYWFHRMLRVANSGGLGTVNADLAMCLLLAWVICYFCIFKGVKTTGKVWRDAGTQVFFSYAVCQGVLTALSSYNKYNNDCYKDCIALCILNSSTSIFAGFVVFSILGFMAHQLGLPMEDLASSGPGLAFIAYPRALSLLPGPQFWSVLFFFMVLLLGLDSQFVCVESLATALTDLFPGVLRKRRELLVLLIAVICFLLGLPFITKGGFHLFTVMDTYGPSGTNLLFIACFETIVVAWVYGANRFYDNIEDMIGYAPFPVLKYCWLFITPLICAATLLYNLLGSKSVSSADEFVPDWSYNLAPLLTVIPMVCIPIFLFISLGRGRDIITPSSDLKQLRPNSPRLTLFNRVIIKPQRSRHIQEDGEEKANKEHTSGV
ncbi:sodium- and chloride-dependent GABA transporter 2-like isoform X5 [Sinocyclocheilus anshuiensis]|uniref:sodium- and chloride-dependent GABA transporter 2-like isoform X5 n=1 Tax=Sinocyclocheilus anshuiensis TaxID=1608454 RepID=UPI0007B94232|nr:PREDICTED: sodium- and chloride-dependent GABA transporter 2-like isoform X5 [Sinocyclocheilus anshuiensis]